MKKKYEKPVIESEEFSFEMMKATCTLSKSNAYIATTYPAYYPDYCESCGQVDWTNS